VTFTPALPLDKNVPERFFFFRTEGRLAEVGGWFKLSSGEVCLFLPHRKCMSVCAEIATSVLLVEWCCECLERLKSQD